MSNRSERRRTKGTPADVVSAKSKRERSTHEGQHGQVVAPDKQAIREAIEAGKCPWCGRGPYKMLAGHVNRCHGIDRRELRELAGLTYHASICDPELSAERSEISRKTGAGGSALASRPRRKPQLSSAGREALRRNGLRFTREERSAAGKIGGARGGAVIGERTRKPKPPCVICEAAMPITPAYRKRKTCSPECRRELHARVAVEGRAQRRSDYCKQGHLMSGDNLKIVARGAGKRRVCVECQRRAGQAYRLRKSAGGAA